MTTTKQSSGFESFIVTPWASIGELMLAHDLLYAFGSPALQELGIRQVAVWRERTGRLPVSLEMTVAAVSAHLRFSVIPDFHWPALRRHRHYTSLLAGAGALDGVASRAGGASCNAPKGTVRDDEDDDRNDDEEDDVQRQQQPDLEENEDAVFAYLTRTHMDLDIDMEVDVGEEGSAATDPTTPTSRADGQDLTESQATKETFSSGTRKQSTRNVNGAGAVMEAYWNSPKFSKPRKLEAHEEMAARYEMSAIVIRFVNGIVDPEQKSERVTSISRLATTLDLDRSLVDLRHGATHNELPSFEALCGSLFVILEWVETYFWSVQLRAVNQRIVAMNRALQAYQHALRTILQEQASKKGEPIQSHLRLINNAIVSVHATLVDLASLDGHFSTTAQYAALVAAPSYALAVSRPLRVLQAVVPNKAGVTRQSVSLWLIQQFLLPGLLNEYRMFQLPEGTSFSALVAQSKVQSFIDQIMSVWAPLIRHLGIVLANSMQFEATLVISMIHFFVLLQGPLAHSSKSSLLNAALAKSHDIASQTCDTLVVSPYLFRTAFAGHVDRSDSMHLEERTAFSLILLNLIKHLTCIPGSDDSGSHTSSPSGYILDSQFLCSWLRARRSQELHTQLLNSIAGSPSLQASGQVTFTPQLSELGRQGNVLSTPLPELVDWVAVDRLLAVSATSSLERDHIESLRRHLANVALQLARADSLGCNLTKVITECHQALPHPTQSASIVGDGENTQSKAERVRSRPSNLLLEDPQFQAYSATPAPMDMDPPSKRVQLDVSAGKATTHVDVDSQELVKSAPSKEYFGSSLFGFLPTLEKHWKCGMGNGCARPYGVTSLGMLSQNDFMI